MRPRIPMIGSVCRSFRPSVRPSVRLTVRLSLTSYFQNLKMKVSLRVFYLGSLGTSQKCRITSLLESMPVGPSISKVEKKVERTHLLVDQTCLANQRTPSYRGGFYPNSKLMEGDSVKVFYLLISVDNYVL